MENIATILVSLVLAVLFFLAIRHLVKKGTCSGCSDNCSSCSSCPSASKKTSPKKL